MPALSGEFLAMSVFFYATHCLHKLGPAGLSAWPTPTLVEMREAARDFCAMDWGAVQDRKVTAVHVCLCVRRCVSLCGQLLVYLSIGLPSW